jgi:acetyl esterase/lipase
MTAPTPPVADPRDLPADLELFPAVGSDETTGGRPIMIVLPGGGYHRLADHEGAPVAEWLAGLGVNALLLRYPVAPARHPAALLRAQEVVAAVRSGALDLGRPVDRSRVGVLGFSAGGHLAAELSAPVASAAETTPRVDLAVLAYAVISMVHEPHAGSLENLLGTDSDPETRRRLSVETRVDASTPPTFLWHTADDAVVPVSHSLRYASALAENGVQFELHVFERGLHGLGLGHGEGPLEAWSNLCAEWLRLRGWAN